MPGTLKPLQLSVQLSAHSRSLGQERNIQAVKFLRNYMMLLFQYNIFEVPNLNKFMYALKILLIKEK